jgi:hypothetical protein
MVVENIRAPKKRDGLPCEKEVGARVPISICERCEFFDNESGFCDKYIEQENRRHKPKPHSLNYSLRTPSDGKRGFYGKKDIRTGGFA